MRLLPGDSLRNEIVKLLRIKHANVEPEYKLATTTADVRFVDDSNQTFPRVIAIEAKDWVKPLTSRDVASIDNLYRPSLNAREIDNLWIIGRHVLSSAPAAAVRKLQFVKYSTFDEFRGTLMNFSGMLQDNILAFQNHEAASNYVVTRTTVANLTLESAVRNWMISGQSVLLIYGGYGMGKTTFSLYITSTLTREYLDDTFNRITIRIPLGGMYTKQDLPALICSALSGGSGGSAVKEFSYQLFIEMNRLGQFILILDGFDEMRHAMDLNDFIFIFEQIKILFSPNAKVIILGRPDYFLSDTQEERVLASLFLKRESRVSKIEALEIDFFSRLEVTQYINNYISRMKGQLTSKQARKYADAVASLPEDELEILTRPVQLRMFTAILDAWADKKGGQSKLTRFEIYSEFIYRFLKREHEKPARAGFRAALGVSSEERDLAIQRSTFMRRIAWWLLFTKKENRFTPHDIPMNILPPMLAQMDNIDAAVRESLVGSVIEPMSRTHVLDKKGGRYYYFPHKSYIEFLVSQRLVHEEMTVKDSEAFISGVNPEILSFLEEGPIDGRRKLREAVGFANVRIDRSIFELCASLGDIDNEFRAAGVNIDEYKNIHNIYIHYLFLCRNGRDVHRFFLNLLGQIKSESFACTVLNCVNAHIMEHSDARLAAKLLAHILALETFRSPGTISTYGEGFDGMFGALLKYGFIFDRKGGIFLYLPWNTNIALERHFEKFAHVDFFSRAERNISVSIGLQELNALNSQDVQLSDWIAHLRLQPASWPEFPVTLKGSADQLYRSAKYYIYKPSQ